MGERNVYCYQCEESEKYMVNLNDVKCRFCGSPAVEFTKKDPDKKAKSEEKKTEIRNENAKTF
jgi:hypothetical protein